MARAITRRVREAAEVSHFERTRRVQHVPHYHRPPKTSPWKDIRVRKAIVIEFVVHPVVPRHRALEVSKYPRFSLSTADRDVP